MDYTSAKELLEEHSAKVRNGHGVVTRLNPLCKKLANKTELTYVAQASEGMAWKQPGQPAYRVVLFGNPILHFWDGDYFTISDHGWFSHTTHARLNEYMPKGFRVYGETPKGLAMDTRRPLGFIRTPNGTYPYAMPAVFHYDGTPYGEAFTAEAHKAISELSAYTSQYLDILLARKECDYTEEGRVRGDLVLGAAGHNSCAMADAILQRKYYTHLVELAIAQHDHIVHAGLTLKEIITVLLDAGASAFKVATTDAARAEHLEYLIKHRLPLPGITSSWLRRTLRPLIVEFIVETLGFEYATWNRREPK